MTINKYIYILIVSVVFANLKDSGGSFLATIQLEYRAFDWMKLHCPKEVPEVHMVDSILAAFCL